MLKRQYKPQAYLCDCKLDDGWRCNQGFWNRSGLTQHINAKHCIFAAINATPDEHRDVNDVNIINDDDMACGQVVPDGLHPAEAGHTIDKHLLLDGKYSHQRQSLH